MERIWRLVVKEEKEVFNLGCLVDFMLVLIQGLQEEERFGVEIERLVLDVLNLKCLWYIQVKIIVGRWKFKYFFRVLDSYFYFVVVILGEVFNFGSY